MTCPQCQSAVADGTAVCPNCGAPLSAPAAPTAPATAPAPPQGAAGTPPAMPAAAPAAGGARGSDTARLTQADWITGTASLVLLVSIFLPWFTVSVGALGVSVSGSGSGTDAHGYLWLVFIVSLLIVVYLGARALTETLPFELPLAHEQLLLVLTGINFVITLIAWIFKPSSGFSAVKVGWAWGSFVSLIAAVVAVAPLAVPAIRARRAGS